MCLTVKRISDKKDTLLNWVDFFWGGGRAVGLGAGVLRLLTAWGQSAFWAFASQP